jgi:hypothetical protein
MMFDSLFSSLDIGVGMCTLLPSFSYSLDSAEVERVSFYGVATDLESMLELIEAPIFYLYYLGLDPD